MRSALRSVALALGLALLAGCGPRNPVLGEWDLDAGETGLGSVMAVKATGLERIAFERDAFVSGETRIEGSYVVEEGRVRFVRADGNGEHAIELLPDDRIAIELPIGLRAVYRKAG